MKVLNKEVNDSSFLIILKNFCITMFNSILEIMAKFMFTDMTEIQSQPV